MANLNGEGDQVLNLLDGMQVYKTLETGTVYECSKTNDIGRDYRYMIYVPNEYDSNTSVHAFMHGYSDDAGAHRNDIVPFLNSINSGNGGDSVLVFYDARRANYDGEDLNKLLEVSTYAPLEKLGISTNNITFEGFSAGGKTTLKLTAAHIQKNPDLPPQVIVTYDATCLNWNKGNANRYHSWNAELTDEEVQALVNNHSTLITFEQTGDPNYDPINSNAVKNLTRQGVDVVYVKRNTNSGHVACLKYSVEDGTLDFLNSKTSSLRNPDDYTFMRWVPDESKISGRQADGTWQEYGEWVNLSTFEVATLISKDMLSYIVNRYKHLTVMEPLQMPAIQTSTLLDNGIVESDLKFVIDNVNTLRSAISSTSFLNGKMSANFSSNSKMPAGMISYMYDAINSTGLLLAKMKDAMDALVNIGGVFQEIDEHLDNKTEELLDSVDTTTNSGNSDNNNNYDSTTYVDGTISKDNSISDNNIEENDSSKIYNYDSVVNGGVNNKTYKTGEYIINDRTKIIVNSDGSIDASYRINNNENIDNIVNEFKTNNMISDVSKEDNYLKIKFNINNFDYNEFSKFINNDISEIDDFVSI